MSDAFERAAAREREERQERKRERSSRGNRTAIRIHATVFVGVQLLLFATWLVIYAVGDGTAHPWFIYPLIGWGIGLAAHYAAVRDHVRARPPAA
jgi:heme/copper-type cytochrome/quinol oxidase subunit 3